MDEDINFIRCEICDLSFTGFEPYEQHIRGKKHFKREEDLKWRKKQLNSKADLEEFEKDVDDQQSGKEAKASADLICQICSKNFTGFIPFTQHSQSGPHAQKVRRQQLSLQLVKTLPGQVQFGDAGEQNENPIYMLVQRPFASCQTCFKDFTGPESYQQHMVSKNHRRKLVQQKFLKGIKENGKLDLESLKDPNEALSDTGEATLKAEGKTESTELFELQVLRDIKEKLSPHFLESQVDIPENESNDPFNCKECHKKFSGVVPFVQHMLSKSHDKKVNQVKLRESLESKESSDSDLDMLETEHLDVPKMIAQIQDNLLTCQLCKMAFSGPESMNAHLKSKKHLSKSAFAKFVKQQASVLRRETDQSKKSHDKDLTTLSNPTNENSALLQPDIKKEEISKPTSSASAIEDNGTHTSLNPNAKDIEVTSELWYPGKAYIEIEKPRGDFSGETDIADVLGKVPKTTDYVSESSATAADQHIQEDHSYVERSNDSFPKSEDDATSSADSEEFFDVDLDLDSHSVGSQKKPKKKGYKKFKNIFKQVLRDM